MTGKEAAEKCKYIFKNYDKKKDIEFLVISLLVEIYEDLENNVCKNCKFYKSGYCYNEDIMRFKDCESPYVDYTFLEIFGCNRFKKRTINEENF